MNMRKLLILFLSLLFVSGCSQDENVLTLVCNGTEEIKIYTKPSLDEQKESNKKTKTYKLENKSWSGNLCSRWNKDSVFCEIPFTSENNKHYISINRISGVISEQETILLPGKMIRFYSFEGKCEKSTSTKF